MTPRPYDAEIEIAERWWLCLRGEEVRLEMRRTARGVGPSVPESVPLEGGEAGRKRFATYQTARRSLGSLRHPGLAGVDFDAAIERLRGQGS